MLRYVSAVERERAYERLIATAVRAEMIATRARCVSPHAAMLMLLRCCHAAFHAAADGALLRRYYYCFRHFFSCHYCRCRHTLMAYCRCRAFRLFRADAAIVYAALLPCARHCYIKMLQHGYAERRAYAPLMADAICYAATLRHAGFH